MTAGQLIRMARQEAGMSQMDLAIRLRTAQSAISRVELDNVSPTVDYLRRCIEATGVGVLEISIRRPGDPL